MGDALGAFEVEHSPGIISWMLLYFMFFGFVALLARTEWYRQKSDIKKNQKMMMDQARLLKIQQGDQIDQKLC